MFMRFILLLLFVVPFLITGCNKDNNKNEKIIIEGFVLTDNLGNQMGLIGSAGNDWKIIDWSQLSLKEQSFLNFSDNIDLNNTSVSSLNDPVAYPNPVSSISLINFHSTDSVKVKIAVVNTSGQVVKTYAIKIKDNKSIAFDLSDNNLFPGGMSLRYYYSYSAASQQNFKAGYGDVKICKPLVFPVTSCF